MKILSFLWQAALTIGGIASWLYVATGLITYSSCPTVGWYIITVPFLVLAIAIGMVIIDTIREGRAEHDSAAEMGKPYENQKSNNKTIAQ